MNIARESALTATALATIFFFTTADASENCSAYPTSALDKIDSSALAGKFGEVPKPTKDLHFAYVTKTLINQFWQDVVAGVKDEAAKYGVKVEIQAAKDESSLLEQLNLAQTVASEKPDALLLSPESDSNLLPVVEAAKAANIPTVIIDDARTAGASAYVGTDQSVIGGLAATVLHQLNPDGGKVADIEGAAGSPNGRARTKGFIDKLKEYPNLQLVASQSGNWDRLTALNAVSNILRQYPDLVGVFATNDVQALGAYEAAKNAGLGDKVAVVGGDAISEAKNSIKNGEMRATVSEFPVEEGRIGVEVALRILGCQSIPQWVVSPEAGITKDNVDKFIEVK